MCGIAGFTQFHKSNGSMATLKQMGQKIFHRGPDAGGEFINDDVGLCHRRLAIIDLSEAGVQPMTSFDDRYVIVFNGEIYNFLERRQALEANGYTFNTHTDTEVILALYDLYGEQCVSYLNGMFAFAIWDKENRSLFMARDRLGKKPLYYYMNEGDVFFASELKSLIEVNAFPKEIRLDAVYDFFAYQYVPDPKTIFKNVFKLEPGYWLKLDENGMQTEQYWDVSFKTQSQLGEDNVRNTLKAKLTDATASRMVSDVPLGAFLSGGVDSSGVVAMMSKSSPDKKVTTCSIGFDNKKYNETEFAKAVAEQYKTDHHEFTVHQNVADNFEKIVSYFDEPFADPSLIPTYFVSELARDKVTVAVAGDGGDEVFAGYSKYNVDHIENELRQKFPKWLRGGVFPKLANVTAKLSAKPFRKATSLLRSLSVEPAMGFYITNSMVTDQQWQQVVRTEVASKLNGYHPSDVTIKQYEKADGTDHLSKILYTDLKTYLPGGILVKVDRMSMANSLEVRAPILDYEIVEYAATIPSHLKFNNGEKKYILKEAFKADLTDDILYRKKMGFSVPLADWLRTELRPFVETHLIDKPTGLREIFDLNQIKDIWQKHLSKEKESSNLLWSMLIYQMWWQTYMSEKQDV